MSDKSTKDKVDNTLKDATNDDVKENKKTQLEFAAVIGAGKLGARIAVELALCNVNVFLYDPIESNNSVQIKIQQILKQTIANVKHVLFDDNFKKMDDKLDQHIDQIFDETMKRIFFVNNIIMAVNHPNLQIIFEAIIEKLDIKINLFQQIEKYVVNKSCILSSNTLSFPIIEISNKLNINKEKQKQFKYKLIGIRWLWPAIFIPFIEITYGNHDNAEYNETVLIVNGLLESINKSVFLCPIKENEWNTKTFVQINRQRLRLTPVEYKKHQKHQIRKYFLYPNNCNDNDKKENDKKEEEQMECIVCLDNKANTVSINCGHNVMCDKCAKLLMVETTRCPVCREPSRAILQLALKQN